MAQKEMCSSCFRETGYRCILCASPFCNQRTVFEENEDVPGWVMGESVAYCEHRYDEKISRHSNAPLSTTTHDDDIFDRPRCNDPSKTDVTSSSSLFSKRYASKYETLSSIFVDSHKQCSNCS